MAKAVKAVKHTIEKDVEKTTTKVRDMIEDSVKSGVDGLESMGEGALKIADDVRQGIYDGIKSAGEGVDDLIAHARRINKENCDWIRKQALKAVGAR